MRRCFSFLVWNGVSGWPPGGGCTHSGTQRSSGLSSLRFDPPVARTGQAQDPACIERAGPRRK